jgi:hypothetical protein
VEEVFRILCQHHRQGLTAADSTLRLLMNRVPPDVSEEAMRMIALTGEQRIQRQGSRLTLGPEWIERCRESEPRLRRSVARRDDGPLPMPILIDLERDLWRAGLRDWDAEGREFRVEGQTFIGMKAAWARSQEMVAERKAGSG